MEKANKNITCTKEIVQGLVQGGAGSGAGGAGALHRLHQAEPPVRCREVQGVQASLKISCQETRVFHNDVYYVHFIYDDYHRPLF